MSIIRYAGARVKNALNFALKQCSGYCGQWGQDRWVVETFRGMRSGFFVDIGAYDGWFGSNTYVLEKRYGWTGICMEPDNRLFEKLRRCRTCTLVNTCIADTEKDVDFTEDAGAFGGMTDTYPPLHRAILQKYVRHSKLEDGRGQLRTVRKHALPLERVLREHHAPAIIDFLSIDTEGAEYTILKDFPFSEYTFLTTTVEHNSHPEAQEQLRTLLESHGYRRVQRGRHDDFYVHPALTERLHISAHSIR